MRCPKIPNTLWLDISRKFYKKIHNKRYRHNEHLWPFVKIKRGEDGFINSLSIFKYKIVNKDISNIKSEDTDLHIILSGPSIKKINYGKLNGIQALGVNGSIMLQDKYPDIKFPFYCLIDGDFIFERKNIVKKIVSFNRYVFVTPEIIRYIIQTTELFNIKCTFIVIEDINHKAFQPTLSSKQINNLKSNENVLVFNNDPLLGFSFNYKLGWFDSDTVAYVAFQVAVWLGMKNIYFHGLDIKDSSKTPRFYENPEEPRPRSWLDEKFLVSIRPSFANAVSALQKRGVQVYNLSDDTAFDYKDIPFIDWKKFICDSSN